MYTAEIINKIVDEKTRRLSVLVKFTNTADQSSHEQDFSFGLGTDLETVRKTIRTYRKELETSKVNAELIPTGSIDISDVVDLPIEPTAAEKKAAKYQEKREALRILKEDVELGLATQAQYDVALASLLAWLAK